MAQAGGWLAPRRADRGGGRRVLHVGLPARPGVPGGARVRTGRGGAVVGRPHRRHRPSLRRPRPPRARPAVPGRGGHRARGDRRRHAAARRCDGLGDHRGGVADPGGDRLLRGHRGVHRRLRSASGRGVDRGPDGLVRAATRPRSLPRSVPRASVAGAAGARVVAGCREGRGGGAPLPERTRASLHRRGALPARRAASTPRRARRRRARLPRGEPPRTRAVARLRAAPPRPGTGGRRGGLHPTGRRGDARPAHPSGDAGGGGGGAARRRRRGGGSRTRPRSSGS